MKLSDWTNTADSVVSRLLRVFLFASTAVLIGTVTLQVFARYANLPFRTIWTSEIARYLYIWVSVIGAALCVHENRLIKVDLLVDRLPFVFRKACEITSTIITIVVSYFLVTSLEKLMPRVARQTSTAARLPMSFVYSAAILAGVTFAFFSLMRLIRWFSYRDVGSIQENDT